MDSGFTPSAKRLLKTLFSAIFLLFITFSTGYSQFIIHVQDWEGVAGSGNWIRNEAPTNTWTRGSAAGAVLDGLQATYISNDDIAYGYDETTAVEAYAYKDIEFPSTGDFYVKFDWKCTGEVSGGTAFDYFRVFMVPTTTALNETDLENETNGFEILGPGTDDRFVEQSGFTMLNYPLTAGENSLVRGSTYRLVLLWVNDANTTDGDPAAIDNIIVSDGDATAPLSGTYEIGKNSSGTQRFDSIMHATALLNMNGVSGNIDFQLTDEDYTVKTGDLPLRIGDFNANPNSTVTNAELALRPLQNGTVTPTISGSRANNAIIFIDRADNITINGDNGGSLSNDLTIENNSPTTPAGIYLGSDIASSSSATNNIEIRNTNINLSPSDGDGLRITSYTDFSAGVFDNVNISNNNFSGGRWAMYINGDNGSANGSQLTIDNNTINSSTNPIGLRGIEVFGTSTISISNNRIGNISSGLGGNVRGIRLGANCSNATIEKNEVYNLSHSTNYGAHAISLATASSAANIIIKNNIIYNISGDGTAAFINNPAGIALQGTQAGISILNNSIYLKEGGSNVLAASAGSYTACLAVETNSVVDLLKNNILINTLGGDNSTEQPEGYTSISYQGTFATQFPDIDYNFYYTRVGSLAGATESLASNFTTNTQSLADLKILSGDDQSSLGASSLDIATFNGSDFTFNPENLFSASTEGDGTYLSIDQSQLDAWLIHAGGTHLADITDDFEGTARNTNPTAIPPSMGAYEFTPSTSPGAAYQSGAISDAGTSEFFVGNRKILSLTWDANGGSLPSAINVDYYPGQLPPDATGYPVFNGYVQVNATGGSGFLYDLELAYEPALLAGIAISDILLTKRSDATADWDTWPTTVNTTDRIMSVTSIDNGFSYFTGTDQNNPLPVELASFSAKVRNNSIDLLWETLTEKNNDHFEVQKKSSDEWTSIATVEGEGNSKQLKKYSSTDFNPIAGTQYYRLKQVDTDGDFEYSEVLRVDYGTYSYQVYPNPFSEHIFVRTSGENNFKRIVLKNVIGKEVNASITLEGNKATVNTKHLKQGTYLIYMYTEKQVEVRKLIKE